MVDCCSRGPVVQISLTFDIRLAAKAYNDTQVILIHLFIILVTLYLNGVLHSLSHLHM